MSYDGPVTAEGEPIKAEWRFVDRLPIHDRMAEIIKLTLEAAKKQQDKYRKQLRRLQYGS